MVTGPAILKKKILWLLLFYTAVAAYFYYEKMRRTMRTAIVSYLLKVKKIIFLASKVFFLDL